MNQQDLSRLWLLSTDPDTPGREFMVRLTELGLVASAIYSSPLLQSMLVVDNSLGHQHWTLIEKYTYVRFKENSCGSWGKWHSCDALELIHDN